MAAGVALAGLAVWQLALPSPVARRRLPDGSTLQIDAVTYGQKHRAARVAVWQRLLGPWFNPAEHGEEIGVASTPANALLCWHSWTNRRTLAVQSAKPGSRRWPGRIDTRDPHGCRFDRRGWINGEDGTVPARGMLATFGRREPQVALQLFEPGHAGPVAELPVPNPTPGPHPTWTSEPLPREKSQGRLTVRLRNFQTGLSWKQVQTAKPPPHARELATLQGGWSLLRRRIPDVPSWKDLSWSRAALQLPGGSDADWKLARVIATDATGNRQDFLADLDLIRSAPDKSGNFWVAFPTGLCPHEAAWSLRFEFTYTGPRPRDRAPVKWTVPDLLVPVPGETSLGESEFKQAGLELRLIGLTGPGGSLAEEPEALSTRPRIHLSVKDDPYERVDLQVEAIDGQGHRYPCRRTAAASKNGEPVRAYTLDLPPDVMLFKLAVTGWNRRTIEFKVQPR